MEITLECNTTGVKYEVTVLVDDSIGDVCARLALLVAADTDPTGAAPSFEATLLGPGGAPLDASAAVSSCGISAGDCVVFSCSVAVLWAEGELHLEEVRAARPRALALSPCARFCCLACIDGSWGAKVIHLESSALLYTYAGVVNRAAMTSAELLVSAPDAGDLVAIDFTTGVSSSLDLGAPIQSICCQGGVVLVGSYQGVFILENAGGWGVVRSFALNVRLAVVSPARDFFVAATASGFQAFNFYDGSEVTRYDPELPRYHMPAVSLCGEMVAFSTNDKRTVHVATTGGAAVANLAGHTEKVTALSFTPTSLFSGSWDATIREWDLHTHACLRVLHTDKPVWSLCVSRGGLVWVTSSVVLCTKRLGSEAECPGEREGEGEVADSCSVESAGVRVRGGVAVPDLPPPRPFAGGDGGAPNPSDTQSNARSSRPHQTEHGARSGCGCVCS